MSQQEIATQVDRVRKLAKPCLAQFAKLSADQCTESYLFSSEYFCGMRIRLGFFEAVWHLSSDEVFIHRDDIVLQTLVLTDAGDAGHRRAA